jgi:uncharacterized membrane protein YgcG
MTKNISEYFMAYEATKVFAIRKMKTQFTKKIRIFYAQTYYRSMQCRRKLFVDWGGGGGGGGGAGGGGGGGGGGGAENEGRRPEEMF